MTLLKNPRYECKNNCGTKVEIHKLPNAEFLERKMLNYMGNTTIGGLFCRICKENSVVLKSDK
jgi:hypothetical protein